MGWGEKGNREKGGKEGKGEREDMSRGKSRW